ncbi:sulfotransferase family 2 domain-containing protein [Marinobacter sp. ATCH36]|uniref:sulfotransferase family 2 domain-containing protein n=1 Tax=Marinobacter sp. ATCH36 TaxID=2945106 RepID=UPI002020DC56|nr:sulfotransferase family 2 domain-containing protein [Marinobacter sp. ATCH36]MCL7945142.1 sulfotransferase family protein [Marinobacter sp. ATCH36]
MRKVILHYHLFKNAGTSLDAAFKENFADGEWVTKEFPGNPRENREQVAKWIAENPQAKVFSSHTAFLPPPQIEGVKVLPVIFVRHPIDRIASAYTFETKQGGDSFGAVLARNTDLSGYIETRLALPNDRQCRNFHMQRLAMMFGEKQGDEFTRAKKAVQTLPFVGIVELFVDSMARLEQLLQNESFEGIRLKPVEKNVTRDIKKTVSEKLKEFEERISPEVFVKLMEANQDDLSLYDLLLEERGKNGTV